MQHTDKHCLLLSLLIAQVIFISSQKVYIPRTYSEALQNLVRTRCQNVRPNKNGYTVQQPPPRRGYRLTPDQINPQWLKLSTPVWANRFIFTQKPSIGNKIDRQTRPTYPPPTRGTPRPVPTRKPKPRPVVPTFPRRTEPPFVAPTFSPFLRRTFQPEPPRTPRPTPVLPPAPRRTLPPVTRRPPTVKPFVVPTFSPIFRKTPGPVPPQTPEPRPFVRRTVPPRRPPTTMPFITIRPTGDPFALHTVPPGSVTKKPCRSGGFICKKGCITTFKDGCPHNCNCKPLIFGCPKVTCPYPEPRCILVLVLQPKPGKCQKCACSRMSGGIGGIDFVDSIPKGRTAGQSAGTFAVSADRRFMIMPSGEMIFIKGRMVTPSHLHIMV